MFSSNSTTTCLIGVVVRTGDVAAAREVWPPPAFEHAERVAAASAPAASDAAIIAGLRLFHFPGPILPPEGYAAPVSLAETRGPVGPAGSHRRRSTISLPQGGLDVN